MNTHLSPDEIKSYLGRTLTKNDFRRVGDHVHNCETCYQSFLGKLEERFPIVIDLDELAGMQGWHLAGEEFAGYVEGRLDELDFECASLHLQECGSCMQKVSAEFEHTLEYPRFEKRSRAKRSTFVPQYPFGVQSGYLPRLALAAAAVLLVALALFTWAVQQPKSQQPQLAELPAETVPLDPPLGAVETVPAPSVAGSDNGAGGAVNQDHPLKKRAVGQQQHNTEQSLIARNLTIPNEVEVLDRTPAIAIRGNSNVNLSFQIVRPFATLIRDDRPTFQWTELDGATSYTVSLFDAALNLIGTSEALTETHWSMPQRLEAGIVYTWTVTAMKDAREVVAPASPARAEFKVLGKPELLKLKLKLTNTSLHLARGLLYAEAGLLDEAEKEFLTQLELRPDDQRAKKLLQTVQSWRPKNLVLQPSNRPTQP